MAAKEQAELNKETGENVPSPIAGIELRGLREDDPRDFLAALGFLRLLQEFQSENGPTLVWSHGGFPIVSMECEYPEGLASGLCDFVKSLFLDNSIESSVLESIALQCSAEYSAPSFRPVRDNIRISNLIYWPVPACQKYRGLINLHKCILTDTIRAWRAAQPDSSASLVPWFQMRMLAALASQIHESTDKKNCVQKCNATMFSFANKQGQKYLLYGLQKTATQLTTSDVATFITGECEPQPCETFRWSPTEYRPTAYLGPNPDFLDVPIKNILAFFGLGFYPVVDRSSREYTLGFLMDEDGSNNFTWPIWDTPLGVDTITSLLHLEILHSAHPSPAALKSIGCVRAWRSRRFSTPDRNLFFSPALPVV